MKNTIKAFTIMEVLINMLISSIIIGMVYFTYVSYIKQLSFFRKDVEEKNHLNRFVFQLKSDFYSAEKVLSKPKSFQIVLYNTENINYKMLGEQLVREQKKNQDSLHIQSVSLHTIKHLQSQEELIQRVSINAYLFDEPIELVITKDYPTIIQLERSNGD
ncbi:type II secretion system protein J [Allomuricauda sp. R78024]|uniref:type II secretion system protein J n=1 Tax=Allomuricauda sp. R78024 TaxID=3093867 RepID=UPI0037CC0505